MEWNVSKEELVESLERGGHKQIFSCQFCDVKQTGTAAYDFPDKYRIIDDGLYCARCDTRDTRFVVKRRC